MPGDEGNAIIGVEIRIDADQMEEVAAQGKALGDRLLQEGQAARSKGQNVDVAAQLRNLQKTVTQAFKQAGDFTNAPEQQQLLKEVRQYFTSLAKAAQQGFQEGQMAQYEVGRTGGPRDPRTGRFVRREEPQPQARQRDPRTGRFVRREDVVAVEQVQEVPEGRRHTRRQNVYGTTTTEEMERRRAGGGPGGSYGGPPGAIAVVPDAERLQREAEQRVRDRTERTRRDRLAAIQALGMPQAEAEGMPTGRLLGAIGTYRRAQAGKSPIETAGMGLAEVEEALQQRAQAAKDAADADRAQAAAAREVARIQAIQARDADRAVTREVRQAARAGRGGAMAEDQGGPGFVHELLQASVLGIGGYRRFGRLGPGALAGGAAQALPTGLITGAAFTGFYALQQGVANAVRQAVQLDRQMANVKDTVQSLGQGSQFPKMRDDLLGISDATGVAGSDVAQLSQIFLGLTGNAAQATQATKAAAQYIEVTGENAQQAGVELSAISQSMGISIPQAASASIAAARVAGRTPQDIQAGVANIAPVGALLGLSANQQYGLIAAASKRSSLTGTEVGTDISRILEGFQTNLPKLAAYGVNFQQPTNYRQDLLDLVKALQPGSLPQANRIALTEALGGPRNVQALAALGGPQAQSILQGNYTGSNALQQRAAAVSGTAAESIKRLGEAAQTFASNILNSGVGTTLADLAKSAGVLLHVLSDFATGIGHLNSAMGGVPAHIVALGAGVYGITRIVRSLRNIGGGGGGGITDRLGRTVGRKLGIPDAEAEKATTAMEAETAQRETATSSLQRFWQAITRATEALTGQTTATGRDTVATDADAAAHELDAKATAAAGAEQLQFGGPGGRFGLPAEAGAAEQLALPGLEAGAGASLLSRLGTRGAGLLRGPAGFGIGLGLSIGGGQLAAAGGNRTGAGANTERALGYAGEFGGLGMMFGGPVGALAGGTAGALYGGFRNIQDALRGGGGGAPPLPRNLRDFLANFSQTHGNAIQQLSGLSTTTTAQRSRLIGDMFSNNNTDLLTAYNQISNQSAAGRAIARAATPAGQRAEGIYEQMGTREQELLARNPALASRLLGGPGAQALGLAALPTRPPAPTAAFAGAPVLPAGQGFATVSDAFSAFQAGVISWSDEVKAANKAIAATNDPTQKLAQQIQQYTQQSQLAASQISAIGTFGQTIGGATPTTLLGSTAGAYTRLTAQQKLDPQQSAAIANSMAQMISSANDFVIQNVQATGNRSNFGQNILTRLRGPGQTISGKAAEDANAALQASMGLDKGQAGYKELQQLGAGYTIQGGRGTSQFSPQQIQSGVQQYISLAQGNAAMQVAQAQSRQVGQAQVDKIQSDSDKAILANLQVEAGALGAKGISLQPAIQAAATKVAQDVTQTTQTTLANIQSYGQYQQSLQFQSPVQQAQTAFATANRGAAALHTTVAALQARPWASIGAAGQNVLNEWAAGQSQMFQAISGQTQAEVGLVQSMYQANPLQAAQATISQLNAEVVKQFGSQANLRAQAARGNQGAVALLTQQNQANFQVFQQQQTNIQAFWQAQGQAAQATGNSVAAAQDTLNGANAALANFRRVNPQAATMANAQYAQLVGQVSQAQGGLFNAQIQQMQAVSQAAQARVALTGNAPAVAALALQQAQQALARFKSRFPSQANMANTQFAQLTAAVYQAQGTYLDQTISFTENQISELVGTNQLSIGQAINRLKGLQAQAKAAGNQAQVLAIQAQIQQYINQGNQNAQFNLPSNLNLPTLYEVRRTEGTPAGGNYYGNHGTVNVSINISNQTDVQPAVNKLMQAVGGPPTTGLTLPY